MIYYVLKERDSSKLLRVSRVGLLQVLKTGGTKPSLFLQHWTCSSSTCISGMLSWGPKYTSVWVWSPVFGGLSWLDHIIRDWLRADMIISVLVIHWTVCCPPRCKWKRRRCRVIPPDLVDELLSEASDRSDIRIGCHTMKSTKRRRWRNRERKRE